MPSTLSIPPGHAPGDRGFRSPPFRRSIQMMLFLSICGLVSLVLAPAAGAQTILDQREELDFDRPESWATVYAGSVTLMTGLGVPRALEPGAVELGLEGGWIPSLSDEERRVGFFGTKEEEINRSEIFARPRLTVGLPARWSVTVGYVPPVDLDGVEPNLLTVALARPLFEGRSMRLGGRLYASRGTIEGDITCDRDAASVGGFDPVTNPFGCLEPSNDELTIESFGLELGIAFPLRNGLEPHLSVAYNRFDNEFAIDARYFGVIDRTVQTTSGSTVSATAGLTWDAGEKVRLTGEAFYTPLDLIPTRDAPLESRDLFNVRVMLRYRLR